MNASQSNPAHPTESLVALHRMGVPVEALHGALLDGVAGRNACSGLHPRWFPGARQHADIVQGLRLRLPKWKASEENGLSTVVSPDGKFQIAVSSADSNVGTAEPPKTLNAKGGATAAAVDENEKQVKLFPGLPHQLPRGHALPPVGLQTWYLLYNHNKKRVAFEFSRPKSVDDDGRPNDWSTRYKFAPLQLEDIAVAPDVTTTPTEHVVDVTRR